MTTAGREEQFRAYVHTRRAGLLRTATFLASGDRFAAEDLVQTALMRLYIAWPRVRSETVDAYTRKALLNALIDDRRRAFRRHEHPRDRLPETAVVEPSEPDGETAVFAALAALPPRMRAAVVLRHLCELSVAETAEALSCSQGTVKSQTARALTQLRATLTPDVLAPADHPAPSGLPADTRPVGRPTHADDAVRTPSRRGSDD
jgi:RNA polymerase sigma-70 factor (sigma-E family)